VPKMERALVYVDDSPNGRLCARLAGQFAADQQVLTTVLQRKTADDSRPDEAGSHAHLAEAAQATLDNAIADGTPHPAPPMAVGHLVSAKSGVADDTLEKELAKGYSIVFVGIDRPISDTAQRFEDRLQRLVAGFDGPLAIAINGAGAAGLADVPLDILVPTGGGQDARLATEIALTLAKASNGTLTALHVFDPEEDTALLRGRGRRFGMSVLVDVHRLGKRSGVAVKGLTATNAKREAEIRRAVRGGRFDLVVLGVSLRQGETKFLGPRTAALLRTIRTPVLLIAR
jgi:nucleotide-binding universal stress UspA family protein